MWINETSTAIPANAWSGGWGSVRGGARGGGSEVDVLPRHKWSFHGVVIKNCCPGRWLLFRTIAMVPYDLRSLFYAFEPENVEVAARYACPLTPGGMGGNMAESYWKSSNWLATFGRFDHRLLVPGKSTPR